jgi:hypothetical protein
MGILKVPVTKAKATLDIDTSELPDAVYQEALAQGLKIILNRGQTKITKETYPKAEELQAAALAKAEETFANMKAGKIRIMGTKAEKTGGAVMTEARRLAKQVIKDEMKRQGIKVSYVEASEITKAANAYLTTDAGKELIDRAKANLEAAQAKASATTDILAGIVNPSMVSEKKKAKIEDEKKKAKAALSATQAGKPRSRPTAQA